LKKTKNWPSNTNADGEACGKSKIPNLKRGEGKKNFGRTRKVPSKLPPGKKEKGGKGVGDRNQEKKARVRARPERP